MKLSDLRPNAKNPRKISDSQRAALKKSLDKFGDLSGFVYNRRTKALISGHQRQGGLPPDSTIKIEVKHESPTAAMTVAEGYVQIGQERFKYREVDADATWEMEALLAANKHGGSWDNDLLRLAIQDTPGLNLDMTGFSIPELKNMNIDFKMPEVQQPVYQETKPWAAEVERDEDEEEMTDEQYIASTQETTEEIPTEKPSLAVNTPNPFAQVEEKMNVVDRRFVIIIDCQSQDHKDAIKEKLRSIVIEAGAKFF